MDNQIGRLVLLDAGSSGTRLYAYKWQKITGSVPKNGSVPKVELVYTGTMEVKKPIETNATEDELKKYLDSLFGPAVDPTTSKENLLTKFGFETPDEKRANSVPIFVLGTAGMRVFKRDHRTEHDNLQKWIESYNPNRAEYGSPKYETITGESEAAYGWVAANFLLGAFSTEYETKAQDTVGYVEMGGQSAQIAFQPFENELTPDKLHDGEITTVKLGGVVFDLVLKTWDLGSNQAWREYQSDVVAMDATEAIETVAPSDASVAAEIKTFVDPDSPHGRRWTYLEESGPASGQKFELKGDGAFDSERFHEKVLKVLDRLSQPAPARGSRLLDANLVAALKARHFVGGANFWYSTRGVFGRTLDGAAKTTMFSFKEYLAEVKSTTALAWPELQFRLRHGQPEVMGNAWFLAEWIRCVLINGFGFNFSHQPTAQSEDDLAFRPYGGTAKAALTWTLGRAVLCASQLTERDTEHLVIKAGINIVAARHQKKLEDAMIAKAALSQESLLDYITMAASFRRRKDVRGNAERTTRMIHLAVAAAKTSRSLIQAVEAAKRAVAVAVAEQGTEAELQQARAATNEYRNNRISVNGVSEEEVDKQVAGYLEALVIEIGDTDREISGEAIKALMLLIKEAAGV
ncbi:hypothetical protein FIBSPDRAFT_1039389 [Athelia psychrophila]|uniref:Nucleoside phosphatase GDA1/CD39 n=1 Tax=Athelia psychrophila TaxID=1759441 RepID=A0A166RTA6_9AGAM|nr:hypothetical protein FIBSPDRAFT_1039389 [Fibularhizoctonia sp. CBS 109695]